MAALSPHYQAIEKEGFKWLFIMEEKLDKLEKHSRLRLLPTKRKATLVKLSLTTKQKNTKEMLIEKMIDINPHVCMV